MLVWGSSAGLHGLCHFKRRMHCICEPSVPPPHACVLPHSLARQVGLRRHMDAGPLPTRMQAFNPHKDAGL